MQRHRRHRARTLNDLPIEQRRLPQPLEWMFRDRTTGGVTIAQFPNVSLAVLAVTIAARWVFDPAGSVATVFEVVVAVSLIWWSVDELVRGVNPWRRLLGGVVLVMFLADRMIR